MNLLLLGLSNAGKSTFIAAINEAVAVGNSKNIFSRSRIEGDITYINSLSKDFRSGNPVKHTNTESRQSVTLHLTSKEGHEFTLVSPDLAGENFVNWYEHRTCLPSDWQTVATCNGVLLFINPNEILELISLNDANATLTPPLSEGENESEAEPGSTAKAQEDSNDPNLGEQDEAEDENGTIGVPETTACTLVELIQMVSLMIDTRPLSIGVIVSAWDELDDCGLLPSAWVKAQLPLLWQFLKANPDRFNHFFVGLSSYGGNPDEGLSEELLKLNPADRILVQFDSIRTSDPSLIIRELISSKGDCF
jgi:hypothetical protein